MDNGIFEDAMSRICDRRDNQIQFQEYCLDRTCAGTLEELIQSEIYFGEPILLYKKLENSSVNVNNKDVTANSVSENSINGDVFNNIYAQETSEEDQSVGGSPLKLQQFHMDCPLVEGISGDISGIEVSKEQRTKINGNPIDLTLARYLLSLYTNSINSRPDNCNDSLWVYCNASDYEGTFLLGALTHRQQAQSTDNSENSSADNNIITRTFKITSKGPYTQKDQFPKLPAIMKKHFPQNTKVKTKCFAEYDIFGALSRGVSMLQTQASLQIKLEWEKCSMLLQTPPLDSKATVITSVSEGDMRSAAYYMYTELHTLREFTNGFKEGVVEWAVENEDETVFSKLKVMLDGLKQGDYGKRMSIKPEGDDEPQSPLKNLVLINRKDLDFTEQLWNILKDCTCYTDLISGLELVLSHLQNGLIQPMVHKSNKSRLAQLVRDSYYGKMVLPAMEGSLPLEILIEIGTEKLQRDYTNAFIGKDLVTGSHLEYFIKTGDTHEEKMTRLEKLHSALEVAVMLEQYLKLPRPTLSMSARQALKYYENNPVEEVQTFSVPVQTNSIAGAIESYQPSLWKMNLHGSLDQQTSVCASYILTTRPVLNNTHKEMIDQCPEIEDDDTTVHYYLTTESENVIVL